MKVFIKYISFIYLKYFFIVFLALELFFVAIDVLNNLALLPKSANLAVLFVVFSAASAVPFLLPLSLVFALIISLNKVKDWCRRHSLEFYPQHE